MSDHNLTIELKEFIKENIFSIAQLDLLFLFYLNPDKFWQYEELSKENRTNIRAVTRNVTQLLSLKLIMKSNESYKYSIENQDTHLKVHQLFNVYQVRPVAVIAFIYERPNNVLQGFADAFKINKD